MQFESLLLLVAHLFASIVNPPYNLNNILTVKVDDTTPVEVRVSPLDANAAPRASDPLVPSAEQPAQTTDSLALFPPDQAALRANSTGLRAEFGE